MPTNKDLHDVLDELKIEHEYVVVPDVAHNAVEYYRKLGGNGFDVRRKSFKALDVGK